MFGYPLGGGNSKKSLKKSKSIPGIFGWVLTFLDPKFKLISVVFQLDYTIVFIVYESITIHMVPWVYRQFHFTMILL